MALFNQRCTRLVRSILVLGLCTSATAATTDVVLWSEQYIPDQSGRYSYFGAPTLNNLGQVALASSLVLDVGSAEAVIQADRTSAAVIARGWAPAALPGTAFTSETQFSRPAQSDAGHVAFIAGFTDELGAPSSGLFVTTTGGLAEIARVGTPSPDGNGSFSVFRNPTDSPTINSAGQVGFGVQMTGTVNDSWDREATFVGDANGIQLIARPDEFPAPSGNPLYGFMGYAGAALSPAINDDGTVAFAAYTRVPGPGLTLGSQVIQATAGSEGMQTIYDGGPYYAAGSAYIDVTNGPSLNESGQVLFRVRERDYAGTGRLILSTPGADNGPATHSVVALEGMTVARPAGGTTVLGSLLGNHVLNDAGQVLFDALSGPTEEQSNVNPGLFMNNGSSVIAIAVAGQSAPSGDAVFNFASFFGDWQFALNNNGQVAFETYLQLDSGQSHALYFWDPDAGLIEIVRGDGAFLDGTLANFSFVGGMNEEGSERSGLNDVGEVAFSFSLTDGRNGVAIWSVPEPGSACLMVLGCLLLRRSKAR